MNDLFNSNGSEIKRVGVWAETSKIEAKEYVIPKKSPDSSDDIPTIPDIDDFQDILEKEISKPPVTDHKDIETANVLAEVGGGINNAIDGLEAAFEALKSYAPQVDTEDPDELWTVNHLLAKLADEEKELETNLN